MCRTRYALLLAAIVPYSLNSSANSLRAVISETNIPPGQDRERFLINERSI